MTSACPGVTFRHSVVMSSLATQFRPASLSQVVGQKHATSVLRAALKRGSLPQQILFSGGSGLGKTTLARCVAAALLCKAPIDGDACRVCESCIDISDPSRTHPDVIEFDAASNGQKDQIRELAARAQVSPVRSNHRVYIIDEAHGLSRDGGQAFLKLLEEPPAHVIFMLATTDPEKMLKTNRSRCVEFVLSRPTDDELAEHLVKVAESSSMSLSQESALFLVRNTDDSLGVRGLLMSLEKISSMLSWGISPDVSEVASLLGLPPSSKIASLVAAIDDADRLEALKILDSIRKGVSEAMIRHSLAQFLKDRLFEDPSAINTRFYEAAVTTPVSVAHTDVMIARLATPSAVDADQRLAEHLERLERELRLLKGTHPAAKADVKESKASSKDDQAKTPAKTSPSKATVSSPELVSLLADLRKTLSVKAFAALQSSKPSLSGDRLALSPPSDAIRARLTEHRDEIKTQAMKKGINVTIKRS